MAQIGRPDSKYKKRFESKSKKASISIAYAYDFDYSNESKVIQVGIKRDDFNGMVCVSFTKETAMEMVEHLNTLVSDF